MSGVQFRLAKTCLVSKSVHFVQTLNIELNHMNDFTFTVSDDWNSGFIGDVIVSDLSTSLDGWTMEFEVPFEIEEIWGANILSQNGDRYIIENVWWNEDVASGQSFNFGFKGKGSSTGTFSEIELNDQVLGGTSSGSDTNNDTDSDTGSDTDSDAGSNDSTTDNSGAGSGNSGDGTNGDSGAGSGSGSGGDSAPDSGDTATPTADLDYVVTDDWGNGFIGDVTVQNTGSTLDGWTMEFEVPFEIEEIWGANVVSKNGDRYTVENVSWNEDVASGQSFNFGFKGKGSSAGTFSAVELNEQVLGSKTPGSSTGGSGGDASDGADGGSSDPVTDTGNDNPDPGDSGVDSDPISSPQNGTFNYGEALQKSFLFYEAQRSGPLPNDNRIDWRGDSGMSDGQDVGLDLTGGYYDAGDLVKFGFPMASSMTMIGWGIVEYEDAYRQSGQLDEALDAIKWGTDYFLNAHVTDGQGTKEFWGQVGDGYIDHSVWSSPETKNVERPSSKIDRQNPGSDLAGETSAALAAASIAFRETDSVYADTLLQNAIQLYDFADDYRGKYSDSIPSVREFYSSWSGYMDELVWGATWLYKATGDQTYLNKAENYYNQISVSPNGTHSWDGKAHGSAVLLAQETGKQRYREDAERWLDNWSAKDGSGITYTDGGLAWSSQWGSLRYTANTAFVAGIYSDTVNDHGDRYSNFANQQVDYLLGENPRNSSYMVGFGNNSPVRPHHASAHGVSGWENFRSSDPNKNILYGALVGGPASANDFDYSDDRFDFIRNEVATDYNAGLTGALARMYDNFGGDPLTDSQLNALPGISVSDAF